MGTLGPLLSLVPLGVQAGPGKVSQSSRWHISWLQSALHRLTLLSPLAASHSCTPSTPSEDSCWETVCSSNLSSEIMNLVAEEPPYLHWSTSYAEVSDGSSLMVLDYSHHQTAADIAHGYHAICTAGEQHMSCMTEFDKQFMMTPPL